MGHQRGQLAVPPRDAAMRRYARSSRFGVARRGAAAYTDGIRGEEARWRRAGGTESGLPPLPRHAATGAPVPDRREAARTPAPAREMAGPPRSNTGRHRCRGALQGRGGCWRDRGRRRSGRRPPSDAPARRRHQDVRHSGGHAEARPVHVHPRRRGPRDGRRTAPTCQARTRAQARAAGSCPRT